jgi:hypothetical protein
MSVRPPALKLRIALGLLAALGMTTAQTQPPGGRPGVSWQTGRRLQQTLQQTLNARWSGEEYRQVLRSIEQSHQIAVMLDRRVDPSDPIDLEIRQEPLAAGLERLARLRGAELRIVGTSAAYLGPPSATARLRTVIALREAELRERLMPLPTQRRAALTARRTTEWPDFAVPAELLTQAAESWSLSVVADPPLPHDLWAAGTLPQATLCETLSLILIQFDLTFRWSDDLHSIEVVALPEQVAIERTFVLPAKDPAAALVEWKQRVPGVEWSESGGRAVARGTVEQLEAVAALRRPAAAPLRTERPKTPLARRQFTLTVRDAPLEDLLESLRANGLDLHYDPLELQQQGVNLQRLIDLELKNASAETVLRTLCSKAGLTYRIEGERIDLEAE